MAEYKVIIADDEPAARRGVRQLLTPHKEFVVVGECRNGLEAAQAIESTNPDVIFLDIQMPEMDGFELIRARTPERMPLVVFLTAYDEFAIKAFEAEAFDYLVKPVTEARFATTIKRLQRSLAALPEKRVSSLVASSARGKVVLRLTEIEWIEAADNYVNIWSNGRSYLLRESLRDLDQRIGEMGFQRAHRNALVRLEAVRKLHTGTDGELIAVLQSGARVPVSRRRRATFVSAVKQQG